MWLDTQFLPQPWDVLVTVAVGQWATAIVKLDNLSAAARLKALRSEAESLSKKIQALEQQQDLKR
jgi:hypothetical protein